MQIHLLLLHEIDVPRLLYRLAILEEGDLLHFRVIFELLQRETTFPIYLSEAFFQLLEIVWRASYLGLLLLELLGFFSIFSWPEEDLAALNGVLGFLVPGAWRIVWWLTAYKLLAVQRIVGKSGFQLDQHRL